MPEYIVRLAGGGKVHVVASSQSDARTQVNARARRIAKGADVSPQQREDYLRAMRIRGVKIATNKDR